MSVFGNVRVFCVSCGIELTTNNPLNGAEHTVIYHILAQHEVKLEDQLTESDRERLESMSTLRKPTL